MIGIARRALALLTLAPLAFSGVALSCLAPSAMAHVPAAEVSAGDPVSRMFAWWNEAFRRPDGFTADAFRRFFTEDATLILNGQTAIRGIPEWVSHFRAIQASGREVEIVVPFKDVFTAPGRVFTYHVIRSRGGGAEPGCMLAAGAAVLRGGRIASLTLVRTGLDQAGRRNEPACW